VVISGPPWNFHVPRAVGRRLDIRPWPGAARRRAVGVAVMAAMATMVGGFGGCVVMVMAPLARRASDASLGEVVKPGPQNERSLRLTIRVVTTDRIHLPTQDARTFPRMPVSS
jgi:hypothetical protein